MSTTITSLTGLQKLPNLVGLNADWVSLQSVNLSGLSKLTNADLSDSIRLDNEGHSLTNVVLTGCTSLESLRLDGSDFSAGIPNLQGLNALTWLDLDSCGITGEVDLTMLPNLRGVDLSSNQVTSLIIPESPIDSINLYNNALTDTAVNSLLQWLNGTGIEGGYLDLSGGTSSPLTGNSSTYKASLENKGWNVYVNQAPPASVSIAPSADFDIVGDFTIEMFVNMNNTDGFPRPYSFGAYPAPNAMSIEGGQLYFWANNAALVNGTFNPTVGQWYHLCVMGKTVAGEDRVYMFIDGFPVASSPYSGSISSQGLPLTIGYGNEPSSGFNGLMSNFRWTSSALYDHTGFTAPTSTLPNVVGTKLLTFQGPSLPQQLADLSGNGHNATSSGAIYSVSNPFAGTEGSLQMGTV